MRFSPTGRGAKNHFCALGVVKLKATPTKIKNGGLHTGCNYDLTILMRYQRTFRRNHHFWDHETRQCEHTTTSGWVIYQRWPPVTGSAYEIAYISACMRDSNEIPTDIPLFLASSIITGLIRILFHVRVCVKTSYTLPVTGRCFTRMCQKTWKDEIVTKIYLVSELYCLSCVYEIMITHYKINTNFYKIWFYLVRFNFQGDVT